MHEAAGGHIYAREDGALLVLVDSPWVGHGVTVLDHGDRLVGQDGLVEQDSRKAMLLLGIDGSQAALRLSLFFHLGRWSGHLDKAL